MKPIQAPVLMINSYVEDEKRAKGGCCIFQNGHVLKELPMGNLVFWNITYNSNIHNAGKRERARKKIKCGSSQCKGRLNEKNKGYYKEKSYF